MHVSNTTHSTPPVYDRNLDNAVWRPQSHTKTGHEQKRIGTTDSKRTDKQSRTPIRYPHGWTAATCSGALSAKSFTDNSCNSTARTVIAKTHFRSVMNICTVVYRFKSATAERRIDETPWPHICPDYSHTVHERTILTLNLRYSGRMWGVQWIEMAQYKVQ